MPTNLVEQSRRATPDEIDAHWERVNREQSRWAALEYARRGANRGVTILLAALDAEQQSEKKQILAIVVAIGGAYIVEVERQIHREPNQPGRYNHIVRQYFDALFWIDGIKEIYAHPNEVQHLMLSVLESAAIFFKTTIDEETAR